MLHELDTALRALVEREIGEDADVEIDFDAPTKDWASHRNRPTIDIYLYDIRQDVTRYQFGMIEQRDGDRLVTARRPMPKFFRIAYLVTAWTQRAEDEHRLLSGLMSTFLQYEALPAELLGGTLSELGFSIPLAVALPPPQDRALSDVWSALGGELKPSLDISLVAPLLPERFGEIGPPVSRRPLIRLTDTVSGVRDEHGGQAVPLRVAEDPGDPGPPADAPPAKPSRARSGPDDVEVLADAGSDVSLAHVLGRLDVLRQRVAALVVARRAVDSNPDDPFLGLYLSDERIDELLRNSRVWVDHDVAAEGRAIIEANAGRDGPTRLHALAQRFAVDDLDVELLLTAMAPDVDDRFERYYGYLNDDVTRRRVSIGLALGLCGLQATGAAGRRRLEPGGRLVGAGLVEVDDPDRPFLTRALRVPIVLTAHVLGGDGADPSLAFVLIDVEPTTEPASDPLVRILTGNGAFAYLHDREETALHLVADAVHAAGMPLVAVDLLRVASSPDADKILDAAVREARLRGGALAAGPVDVLAEADVSAVQRLTAAPVPLLLTGQRGWEPSWAHRPPYIVEAPQLAGEARARIWDEALRSMTTSLDFDAADVTAPYRLGAGAIRQAAAAAATIADLEARSIEAADVRRGARQQNAARLERLARRIEPAVGWDDLVLPPPTVASLRGLADRARHRELVLGTWRMRPGGGRGTGITSLFAGDSGTGKTMSAEVIAADLGLDLYVVNLATVVDKYIGETEKNLDRIFAEADNVNGVLLFDEADALFGQRSEVRDSHDRYANIEVAYLLQRMETFDGLAVLSTNLRSNIDDAFTRRIDVIVDFALPDATRRRRLWEHSIESLPQGDDLDLDFVAGAFELSGGNIRSIAVTLAYRAASGERAIDMGDVVRAVAEEYRKLGRLTLEAEFGQYFPLLRP